MPFPSLDSWPLKPAAGCSPPSSKQPLHCMVFPGLGGASDKFLKWCSMCSWVLTNMKSSMFAV